MDAAALKEDRYLKFRKIGEFSEAVLEQDADQDEAQIVE